MLFCLGSRLGRPGRVCAEAGPEGCRSTEMRTSPGIQVRFRFRRTVPGEIGRGGGRWSVVGTAKRCVDVSAKGVVGVRSAGIRTVQLRWDDGDEAVFPPGN